MDEVACPRRSQKLSFLSFCPRTSLLRSRTSDAVKSRPKLFQASHQLPSNHVVNVVGVLWIRQESLDRGIPLLRVGNGSHSTFPVTEIVLSFGKADERETQFQVALEELNPVLVGLRFEVHEVVGWAAHFYYCMAPGPPLIV